MLNARRYLLTSANYWNEEQARTHASRGRTTEIPRPKDDGDDLATTMAPMWPAGEVIDLTADDDDDEPATQSLSFGNNPASTSKSLLSSASPRFVSTTPIPVPQQPSWAATAVPAATRPQHPMTSAATARPQQPPARILATGTGLSVTQPVWPRPTGSQIAWNAIAAPAPAPSLPPQQRVVPDDTTRSSKRQKVEIPSTSFTPHEAAMIIDRLETTQETTHAKWKKRKATDQVSFKKKPPRQLGGGVIWVGG